MFTKILIANRGEIACRVAATARRMGVKTVAVYSEADARAKHVQACDEAVLIGGPAPKDSYLQWQRIIDAAKATGAQAVHPGYGFLSENEDFAKACAENGLVFIGPSAQAILAMGLKAESKRLMEKAGVPLVPGYHGADQDAALLKREAQRIGFPVLIKASAGGGGKGMRAVLAAEEFDAALASCKREAINSFGDDAVLIERYVQRPRHVEIQVFGDNFGDCVYLFERDCSVQRRHQKVLEEAPAPGMSEARRQAMGEAAVAAAKAVGYSGAGTVEFICEHDFVDSGRFYFMEMNTRLQVEHPVTEAITGQDLVEWQLRVAAGQPLPLKQSELRMQGHAIEARICAENPEAGFLPATGALKVARWPEHVTFERGAVRIDAGVGEGDEISPFYDSMVAKLIVWGEDRAQALARLDAALRDTHIVGLQTNVAFLRRCAATASFAQADLDTALIERERAALFDQPGLPLAITAAAVVAHKLAHETVLQDADPWSHRDGWRLSGASVRRFDLRVGDHIQTVGLSRHHQGGMQLQLADQTLSFAINSRNLETHELLLGTDLGQSRVMVNTYAVGETIAVFAPQGSALVTEIDPIAHAGDGAAEAGRLTAPMPGKLVSFLAQVGATVSQGQPLAVMEAMKMEHTILAPRDGVVAELLFAVGDQVGDGAELLRLKTAD
ncbi:acetyl/propionyl/methylcrotonyl-CoA carboxylase subunit alpha [Roseateles koreensis]|uniref:Acetyl/propionyl/methylcrotonyl-CoA carboxylase subunit alpha n=1 Tax=Roseateles koreensis TaxID=2987526 RepID=A0ABT5KSF0_9BURK|nr:acetyl/propionyl/methylcrotonyl-CoA carboxylase subunit alpha [Roseateles koreensis]MDC8785360.1 acetyl/propionyl/methylcrotonyl-CoA carboxylase subunit alpha [Roseateles koreensis]